MKKFLSVMLFLGFVGISLFPGIIEAEVSDPSMIRALQEQVASLMQRVSELQVQLQRINSSAVSPIYQSTVDPYPQDNPTPISFSCGDTNMDGKINNDDATVITNYIFSGGTLPAGVVMSDADGNGVITISDSVYLINYINSNGAAPKCNLGINSTQVIGVGSPAISKFQNGWRIQVKDSLNIRVLPGGNSLGTQTRGTQGVIVDGPQSANGYVWYKVDYDNSSLDGWSVQDWMEKSTASTEKPYFTCADLNSDGVINLADANAIQDYIFNGGTLPSGRGDVDGSGMITVSDFVYLINYVSAGGANPKCGASPISATLTEQPVQKVNPQPVLPATPVPQENVISCGDLNLDGKITSDDANVITNYIFNGGTLPSGQNADVDGSGSVNISDATAIVNYVNKGTVLRCSVAATPNQNQFSCGDTNMDGKINNDDATVITNYIFSGGTLPAGVVMSDADGNGRIDISDSVYLINYVNANGQAPKCPIKNQSIQESAAAASIIGTTGGQLDSILSKFQNLMRSLR